MFKIQILLCEYDVLYVRKVVSVYLDIITKIVVFI